MVDSGNQQEITKQLDDLRRHYDLACQLVEQINRSFGFVLLLITVHDFSTCIMDFSNLLDHFGVGKRWQKNVEEDRLKQNYFQSIDIVRFKNIANNNESDTTEFIKMKSDPIQTCQFVHPLLRFLLLLVASNRVESKVYKIKM